MPPPFDYKRLRLHEDGLAVDDVRVLWFGIAPFNNVACGKGCSTLRDSRASGMGNGAFDNDGLIHVMLSSALLPSLGAMSNATCQMLLVECSRCLRISRVLCIITCPLFCIMTCGRLCDLRIREQAQVLFLCLSFGCTP